MSEHPARYRAASLLADITQDPDELSAIEGTVIRSLAMGPPPEPATLERSSSPPVSVRQYRDLLYHLREAGLIDEGRAEIGELRAIFDTARILAGRGPTPENRLVANTPLPDADVGDTVGSLVVDLLELIQQASSELVILNPFFSERGDDRIGRLIGGATARGVDVTIMTKSLSYGGTTQNERVMDELLGDEDTDPGNLQLYEYVLDDDPSKKHPPTIHAKLTIADGERAYLGTANMTHRGLVENLELGVILQDDSVDELLLLVRELSSSEYLHPVEHTSTGFERL
jgi:phosphatidylserine/phosphatidylglycerophosphate/cardiolipin synthase-like enzyme